MSGDVRWIRHEFETGVGRWSYLLIDLVSQYIRESLLNDPSSYHNPCMPCTNSQLLIVNHRK